MIARRKDAKAPRKATPRNQQVAKPLNWTADSLGSLQVEREHARKMADGTIHKLYADIQWDGVDARVEIRHRIEDAEGTTLCEPTTVVQLAGGDLSNLPDAIALLEWSQQQLKNLKPLLAAATSGAKVPRVRTTDDFDD